MTQQEVISYFESALGKLWPNWKTNETQILAWAKELKCFEYSAVRRATQEHFTSKEGSYGRPKLPMIIELARKYQPKKAPVKVEPCNYDTDVFVQCIEHDNPIKLFQFFGVYVARQYQNNRDYILNAAECTRRKVEHIYGGVWIVIQGTTHSVMRDELAEQRRLQSSKKQLSHQP